MRVKFLNAYSWLLIIAFILVIFTMEYFSPSILWDGILTLPLMIGVIVWSEKADSLIKNEDRDLTKMEVLRRDFFLITYSFILGGVVSLLFYYNNSDVKGWWPLIICFNAFYAVFFAAFFSLIAMLLTSHRTYSMTFAIIIFVIFSFSRFWPYYFDVLFIGDTNSLLVICLSLMGLHLLICLSCKLFGKK